MDEATAYQWAHQALRGCTAEIHVKESCLDRVAAAIQEAASSIATAPADARVICNAFRERTCPKPEHCPHAKTHDRNEGCGECPTSQCVAAL